jgi:hypothetical protein
MIKLVIFIFPSIKSNNYHHKHLIKQLIKSSQNEIWSLQYPHPSKSLPNLTPFKKSSSPSKSTHNKINK